MKKSVLSKLAILLVLLILTSTRLQSQTIIASVLTQPCNNNGQIGVTVTGLTPPISYTYSNYNAGVTISHPGITSLSDVANGLSAYQDFYWMNANYWSISATDGINTIYANIILTPPFQDTIKVHPGVCPAPSTLEAIAFVGGTAPFSVVWTNTATALSYNSNPALVPDGTYTFMITDAAGCSVRSAVGNPTTNITVLGYSSIVTNVSGSPANCTNATATVSATGGTAPYTYLWSNSATSQNLSGLSQGPLTCVVADAIGCHGTGGYYITQAVTINFNTSVGNSTCGQANGSIVAFASGGTAPYAYLWSNASTTQNISGLQGNLNYLCQVTDALGCTGYGGGYVGVTTPISVTYTASPSPCTSAGGSATVTPSGGTAPYTIVWNTFPTSSIGTSISSKPVGDYHFTVTDAIGCIQTGIAHIPPSSIINANILSLSVICPATTGNLQVYVTGSNGPFTYLWSTASTSGTLINVPVGYYSCVITDAAGCSVTKSGSLVQGAAISVGFTTTPSTCLYSNDGSATAVPIGGTAPYTFVWSNSQTSATASNLLSGYYQVYVTDANGCHNNTSINSQVYVNNSGLSNACYCTITGTVYADANNNCVRNALENGIPNIQVHCSGVGYVYTNVNGVYSFLVPSGTYTITESVQAFYPLSTCQSNNAVVTVVAAPGCVSTVNFGNSITPVHDLHIITTQFNSPVPGNTYQQQVIVQNEGTLNETTVKLGYKHDGQLTYGGCSPWALTQLNSTSYPNWYSIASGFPSLIPNASTTSYINYLVPTNIPLGTQVVFYDTTASAAPIATNWLTDYTPWNNVNTHQAYVQASYDPNFKEVSPRGAGPQGNISTSDSVLTYVVHFQNEGNYFAQNVVVLDSIDPDLNISTLRPGYSDHKYTVSINETGVVSFNFKNINLPWKSQYGNTMSSGMFTYSIKMKKNLPIGRQIKNKADIYFDYNDPITTNTTLNTIFATTPVSISELKSNFSNGTQLFPNPASNEFNLMFNSKDSKIGVISIFDISGREISSNEIHILLGDNTFTGNAASLQNGIYLVQLKTNSETITKKLVVSK